MNRTQLKNYAPGTRRDFITAITSRARTFGITKENIAEANIQGDVLMIEGRPFPVTLASLRKKLVARIILEGFDQVIQAMAYTWFNRFVAIRYMELHGYLDHGYRVLSHPQGQGIPEILLQASHVDLPGLNKEQVIDWQLDGNKDAELYRMLLIAQCNALHQAMPFLFERIDDETELLLPDNLLHSDSVIRKLVNSIDEASWNEIEIIGWLYQFYISERKDQVMGKVVATADIPAATQLFTPNWIVKYLVQNSIGAQWLATYPESDLKERMDYYIEPAEQTEAVKQQLAAITPDELNPEELTLIDPACGSGHILVEAYDLFKAIYQERGYPRHKIPQLILEKNLFGLDIDTRAAQMAGFALLMKARADSPRILSVSPALNVYALHDSKELDDKAIAEELYQAAIAVEGGEALDHGQLFGAGQLTTQHSSGLAINDIQELIRFFENGTTFGSLLTVPKELEVKLPQLQTLLEQVLISGNALAKSHAQEVLDRFLKPAQLLAAQYDAVVANPPYMNSKSMTAPLKAFVKEFFRDAKTDLYACFIDRGFTLAKSEGFNAMVTMQNWMFQSSFVRFRSKLLEKSTTQSAIQIGFNSFPTLNTKIVLACAVSIRRLHISQYMGKYINLNNAAQSSDKNLIFLNRDKATDFARCQRDFDKIPDKPIAYWANFGDLFNADSFATKLVSGGRCKTHADHLYVRAIWEVAASDVKVGKKWKLFEKGGDFRKWFGNRTYVVDWSAEAKSSYASHGGLTQEKFWSKVGITWSDIAIINCFRFKQNDSEYSSVSPTIFPKAENEETDLRDLSFLNSKVVSWLLKVINPSIHANPGDILKLPINRSASKHNAERAIRSAELDWDSFETSWDFQISPLITQECRLPTVQENYTHWQTQNQQAITEMKSLEEENNRLFIDAYGLQNELTPDVPIEQITLTVNPPYRYGRGKTEAEYEAQFRSDTMKELVSYAIGCMMGRYSLDKEGLVYAHAANKDFDASQYPSFPADDDGIIPITDYDWFSDDACNRLVQFIETAWPKEKRDENLLFLAEGLGKKAGDKPVDALRRYLSRDFFKDHLKTYKKRPIYWLFSSGKHKAFECLVYLHRYNEGTLSRMRQEYVQKLLGRYESRIKMLQDNIASASSTSARKKMEKELTQRQNQQLELRKYDEQLRYFTDQRIALDLDDGVKVNYGKFGTLLANVKDVTGVKG